MNSIGLIPPTPPSVVAQIARLPELPMVEIKALWQRLYQRAAPTHNRQFLERRIAYKLQEVEFRKVNPELLVRNRERIEALIAAGENKKPERGVRLQPGTVLTREYQGVEHRVTVTLGGQYEFEGFRPTVRPFRKQTEPPPDEGPVTSTRYLEPLHKPSPDAQTPAPPQRTLGGKFRPARRRRR